MRLLSLALLPAVLLLAACASAPPGSGQPGPGGSVESDEQAQGAVGLLNLWRVSGAEGEQEATWLRIDEREFQLWRDCGMVMGTWRTSGPLFLASVHGASGECAAGSVMPTAPWLEQASSYEATAEGWQLLDTAGHPVASLTIDGAPEAIPTAADFYTEPPEVTDAAREALRPAGPLPAILTPPTAGDLAGRWVPAGAAIPTDPHVVFEESGAWTGSDGCNGGSGRWAADGSGALLATSGASTLMACDGALVPSWVAAAHLAGFDGETLVLLDASGGELGRLARG